LRKVQRVHVRLPCAPVSILASLNFTAQLACQRAADLPIPGRCLLGERNAVLAVWCRVGFWNASSEDVSSPRCHYQSPLAPRRRHKRAFADGSSSLHPPLSLKHGRFNAPSSVNLKRSKQSLQDRLQRVLDSVTRRPVTVQSVTLHAIFLILEVDLPRSARAGMAGATISE